MFAILKLKGKINTRSLSSENHKRYPESIYKLKGKKFKRNLRDKVNHENKYKVKKIDTGKNKKRRFN